MNEIQKFQKEVSENIENLGKQEKLKFLSREWLIESTRHRYSYNFSWMGRPIIQYPQDIVAIQELIHDYDPDVIVETGIAHGGSLFFSASMLQLMGKKDSFVLGVDIDIRKHNRTEIERSRFIDRIKMIEGSSIDPKIVREVQGLVGDKRCMVILDSNHTHSHVLQELKMYQGLVKKGGHLIVLDTSVEDMPDDFYNDRPWNQKDNPKTAVREFLSTNSRFQVNSKIENKIMISMAYCGYLECIHD
jgi:cephalosporin hydroxylase